MEPDYEKNFASSGIGAPALGFRIALGALIIKETLKRTDEETAEQIQENPYLQYFLGFTGYRQELPFDASMMVHFRKRLKWSSLKTINTAIVRVHSKKDKEPPTSPYPIRRYKSR